MRRVELGRSLWIAGVLALIPLLGNVLASFLTESAGLGRWLVVPAVAVGVAMVQELVEAYRAQPDTPPGPYPPAPDATTRQVPRFPRERRGTPLPIALLAAVLVLGAGGFAVASGVRYVSGWLSGNEPGTERLREPAVERADGLTLRVESVLHTAHFTRVRVAARNDTGITLSLPLFRNCRLVSGDGTTLDAENFKSDWSSDLTPGVLQRGTITFGGHLPDGARRASLAFSTVFAQGLEGPRSIRVRGIKLKRP